ncbi:hypothetical protein PFISCL1PPCAC_15218 [Pristionchus fissidentatus]|uniref:Tr-type G domain-containing protein n=1 Tax=Pristionchus fissidentatus TaxID=1538716 RepID=A0AAV5VWL0_9BILA|nr:hypothetical protein PFISCL1PPCAC_15218 [Pristionchus fissidentatus]
MYRLEWRLLKRAARLSGRREYSIHPTTDRIRNIGVVAHIDAGKTTLTERLLYLSGELKRMGNVDSGSTVTDFLEVERERGITIQSAIVSLPWKEHRINLIDTPGHVDFGVEVQRCVRVLDGLLVVLDGSAGVQAQTLTVWRQASKYHLPSLFLINKMDKPQADFNTSLTSIEDKLGVRALPVVIPFLRDNSLNGFIDLLGGKILRLSDEKEDWMEIKSSSHEFDSFSEGRENLCLGLSDSDDSFSSLFLDKYQGDTRKVCRDDIAAALQRASLSRSASAVASGSALRSAASVQPCLDLVLNLLPSPSQTSEIVKKSIGNRFSGLLFKISHDKRRGRIGYTRVYSGELRGGTHLWNQTRGEKEGPIELFEAQSDSLDSIKTAREGDIVVVRGLEKSLTGDALIALDCEKRTLPEDDPAASIVFDGIDQPDPVFYCSIEPPDMKTRHALERALKELEIEDPSLRIREDSESGQTIMETMGELHVEIVKDRLKRGYGLNAFLGPLQVSYREVVQDTVVHTAFIEDTVDGRTFTASVTLRIEPEEGVGKWKKLKLALPPGTRAPRPDWQQGLREGVGSALHHGPLLSFPVYDVSVSLLDLTVSGGKVGANLVCAAAHKCIEEGLTKCGVRLVEPVMELELTLPVDCPSQSVLHELTRRRATIDQVTGEDEKESKIRATLPLSSLAGLSTAVRTLSRGLAHLHIRPIGHELLDGGEENRLINQKRMMR